MFRKVKFSLEFKKQCMDMILINHRSLSSVSEEKGVSRGVLKHWKTLYVQQGITGLIPKQTKRYSASFKLEVLDVVSKGLISLKQASIDYNIGSSASIINWQRQYNDLGFIGLQNKPKGRPSIMKSKSRAKKAKKTLSKEEELLLENKSLKAELDYLKKLQALIQAKESKEKRH